MEKGISQQRHKEIGALLQRMQRDLNELAVEFSSSFGLFGRHNRSIRYFMKAAGSISKARSCAENIYARDFPLDWKSDTYYGREE